HHLSRRAAALQELPHHAHQRAAVSEEAFEPGAKVVMTRLAVLRQSEAILRAAAVAKEAHLAVAALLRQRIALVVAELPHLRRSDEVDQRRRCDIAELLARLDEMVTRVDVAIVFQRWPVAACRRMDAQEMGAEIGFQRHVE